MEEQVSGLQFKVYETVNTLKSLSERITSMADSSGCSGELCNCVSNFETLSKTVEDIKSKVKLLMTDMKQRELKDKDRDENINILFKEINSIKGQQDINEGKVRTSTKFQRSLPQHTPNAHDRNKSNDSQRSNIRQTGSDILQKRRTNTQGNKSNEDNEASDDDDNDHEKDSRLPKNSEPTERSLQRNEITSSSGTSSSNVNFRRTDMETDKKHEDNTQSLSTALVPKSATSLALTPVSGEIPVSATIQQMDKEYYLTNEVWTVEAQAEVQNAKKTEIRDLEGAKTVLLLDTSASMANADSWTQMKTFVTDYLSGLERISPRVNNTEHVSIVTFGSQTKCLQRYTNDFTVLRAAFESIQLGGPSPMYGGLLMAHAVAISPKETEFKLINGMQINTKIILITDGEPTELCLHRGPDVADEAKMDETKARVVSIAAELLKRDMDIFCVPVGNANMDFLNMILSKEGRRVLSFRDGHHFSRRLFLANKFLPSFNIFGGSRFDVPRGNPEITGRDYAHMQEILDDDRSKVYEAIHKQDTNPFTESHNQRLLPIGTRVRRGPDWEFQDEDGEGPGTVVGHHLYRDLVWVHWDVNDEIIQYRYGDLDQYGVFQVEEPRIPLPGQPLDVGCVVCTGKDWKSDVTAPGSTGVVMQMQVTAAKGRKAVVRWENGKRGLYSYGDDRIYEIQIYLPGSQAVQALRNTAVRPAMQSNARPKQSNARPKAISYPVDRQTMSATGHQTYTVQTRKPNKNKNKN